MRAVLEFLDPFNKRGFYAVPGLALIAAVAVVILLVIALTAQAVLNAHFYRSHFKAPLHVPHTYKAVHVPPKLARSLPTTGSIYFQYFTMATNDQDGLGSCQGWAFVKQASYAYNWNRQANGKHYHRFFSPRFAYDMVSAGQDQGSYLEQYPPVAQTGIPRWITFPYGPYQVDYPIPVLSPLYRLNITEHQLFANQGAGSGGVLLIKHAITTRHAPNFDFPVFPEYDQANADGSTVVLPKPGETDRGGHANTCVKFDDNHPNGDGTVGAVLCSNQWGNDAGVGADGVRHAGPNNGFVWFSYGFVGQYVWNAAVIHVSTAIMVAHVGHTPPFKGPVARRLVPPPAGVPHKAPSAKKVALSDYYVHGVYATDRPYDLSPLFNADGARWGVSPVGLAATYASECGLKTGVNGDCDRIGYGADVSGGGCQVTVGTAAGYGIGNGLSTPGNIFSVFAWEDNPVNCIELEAHIMHDYSTYRGGAPYPGLNILWNCGPATTAYPFPYGQCASNYYGDFLGWWNFSLSHWATYQPPPPPKPIHHYKFPKRTYQQYRRRHHLKAISPYYHHKLAFAPSVWWTVQNKHGREVLGGILRHERYNHRRQVMTTSYQCGKIFTWTTHPGWTPKVQRHRCAR